MVSRRKGETPEEHRARQREYDRLRADAVNRRNAERYATDPEYRERKNRAAAAWWAEHADDPEFRERNRERFRERYATDPEFREAKNQRDREYYREHVAGNPEVRERTNQRAAARLRERYATDPEFRERENARRSERLRIRADRIAEAEGWQCWLCGEAIDREARHPDPLSLHLDHMIPRARGGANDPANLAPAHAYCNLVKNDRLVADVELPPDLLARARALRNTNDEEAA